MTLNSVESFRDDLNCFAVYICIINLRRIILINGVRIWKETWRANSNAIYFFPSYRDIRIVDLKSIYTTSFRIKNELQGLNNDKKLADSQIC